MALLWLIVIGLGVWVWTQSREIAALRRTVADLIAAPRPTRPVLTPQAPPPAEAAVAPPQPPPPEPVVPEHVPPEPVLAAPATAPSPILEPSPPEPVVAAPEPAKPEPVKPEPVLTVEEWRPPPLKPKIPERWRVPAEASPAPVVTAPPPPPPPPSALRQALLRPPEPERPRIVASTWLAENGLAWLGGLALMAGGLFLVVYAAQRGVFTPPLRIGAAVLLGLGFLGASEWVRRRPDTPGSRHPLVAAVLAGAGASTLYAAFWSAFALYHLIGLPVAAVLIGATSLGLLALAVLHGEALGVLAIVGALLSPMATDIAAWKPLGLEIDLALVVAAGFGATALRRWGTVGALTLLGAVAWSLGLIAFGERIFGAVLALGGVVGSSAGVVMRRGREPEVPRADLFTALPSLALIAASLVILQFRIVGDADGLSAIALAIGLTLAAAVLIRLEATRAVLLAAPAAVAALPALASLLFAMKVRSELEAGLWMALAAAMAGSALALGRGARRERETFLGVGAVGAAAIAGLMWARLELGGGWASWTPPAALALLLGAGAALLARDAKGTAGQDRATALWILSAAESLFLAIHAATADAFAPAMQALAALALAFAASRLGWRGLATAAVAGAVIALAELLKPGLVLDALHGRLALAAIGGAAAAAALPVWGGAWLLRSRTAAMAEAMATAALASALLGAFLVLHRIVAGPTPTVGAEPLLEASLRTDVLLAAALMLAWRTGDESGPIARWRLGVVLGLGVLNGVAAQGWLFNPWWGVGETPLGPPLINTLALDYLAPAALLTLIARRRLGEKVPGAPIAALAAFGAGLIWAVLEVRRDFAGAQMASALIVRNEAAAYGLVLMAAAIVLAWLSRRWREATPSSLAYLAAVSQPYAWAALALGGLIVDGWMNPWWGVYAPALRDTAEAGVFLSEMALAAGGAAALGALAWRGGWTVFARSAWAVFLVEGLALAALGVRIAFHGLGCAGDVGRAEGVAYALLLQATALALGWLKGRLGGGGAAAWLMAAGRPLGWVALALATWAALVWVNPWWGPWRTPLSGPGEATLMFGAIVLATGGAAAQARAAWRAQWPLLARAALVAVALDGFVLALLAVRGAFHGLAFAGAGVERAEAGAYGLILLATALGLIWTRRRADETPRADAWLSAAAQPFAWPATGVAVIALAWWASPWWGPIDKRLAGPVEAALIFATLALGALACSGLSRLAGRLDWRFLPQTAKAASVLLLFVLLTLMIRWLFRGDDMRLLEREASLETWVFSAAWALFGLGVLVTGGARRDITLRWLGLIGLIGTFAKVMLFDSQMLSGVIRAGSWMAVGVLSIVGALQARRLNADGAAFFRLRRPGPKSESTEA